MSNTKLFHIRDGCAEELRGESAAHEKSLQAQIEQHLPTLLGVKLLASEHSTGKKHGGRIDTLGIDENNVPVFIEYKRAVNENVINPGLFYLGWLLDHRAEFELLVMRKLANDAAKEIGWQRTRLVCIAGDFPRYDQHAVTQINRNVELILYNRYGSEWLLLDLVNASDAQSNDNDVPDPDSIPPVQGENYSRPLEYLARADQSDPDLYDELLAFARTLGDDMHVEPLRFYIAYCRIKNFMCVELHPTKGALTLFLKVDSGAIDLVPELTRDVSEIGHHGTSDLKVTLRDREDLTRGQTLIPKSHNAS